MSKKSPTYLIGDLLVRSELLSRQVVADAIPISLSTRLPLGSVLVSSGHLDEQTVQALVLAQSLIRDKFLSEELAAEALKLAHTAGLGLKEALKQLGWKTETFELTNRLGQFFLDAEIITAEQLAKGLASFGSSGLPLARSLVLEGVISSALAFSALSAQKLVRDEIIGREQAIEALKSAAKNGISIETSLSYYESIHIEPLNRIRLGEILVLSNLISESELLEMVERSIVNEELIGETFVKAGLISHSQLKDALHLQQLFNHGKLTIGQITDVMRRILASGMTVEEAIELVTAPSVMTAQFSGPTAEFVINKDELQPAMHSSPVYETADD
ncbi:MAG: hypothetical protein K2X81_15885, partial [Candidatus Obscuribacterales bacterium]|nr:hypothetical protein [Candidatus Obscuribacterales bacterium]